MIFEGAKEHRLVGKALPRTAGMLARPIQGTALCFARQGRFARQCRADADIAQGTDCPRQGLANGSPASVGKALPNDWWPLARICQPRAAHRLARWPLQKSCQTMAGFWQIVPRAAR